MVEPGEEAWDGARREVREETGLTELDFRWGQVYRETRPYAFGKIARYYVAVSEEGEVYLPVNPDLGRPEHEEFVWADYAETRRLLRSRLWPILDWANRLVTSGGRR